LLARMREWNCDTQKRVWLANLDMYCGKAKRCCAFGDSLGVGQTTPVLVAKTENVQGCGDAISGTDVMHAAAIDPYQQESKL